MIPTRAITLRLSALAAKPNLVINPEGQDPQLEIDLSCTMSITPDANMASVRVMNLSRATRERLAGVTFRNLDVSAAIVNSPSLNAALGGDPIIKVATVNGGNCYVEIDGGYLPTPVRMFEGSAQWIRHQKNGPTWITEMQVGDGLSTASLAVANKVFPGGTHLFEIIDFIRVKMGLGPGNVSEANIASVLPAGQTFIEFDFVAFGDCKWLLSSFIKDFSAEWFIDRGELYIVRKGEALPETPVTVSFEQGLINQPEPIEGGQLRVRSMLRPDVRLGRKVTIERANFAGTYRVERVAHAMNNRGGSAITDMILSPGTGLY